MTSNINILQEEGDLPLICDEKKCISLDSFVGDDEWKVDYLEYADDDKVLYDNSGLASLDLIWENWLNGLTMKQLSYINDKNSLRGIPIPKEWILTWRFILKYKRLRDSESAARNGMGLKTFAWYWCTWAEQAIEQFASPMEKEMIAMNDAGYLREEIGLTMMERYGDEFWKKRKEHTTTTPVQVVNNYFYIKMPTDIAKNELIDLAKKEYHYRKQNGMRK